VEKQRVVAPHPKVHWGLQEVQGSGWLLWSLRWGEGWGWAREQQKGMEELGSLKLCGFPCSEVAAPVKLF